MRGGPSGVGRLFSVEHVILLEGVTSSNIPLGSKVQWRDKTGTPPCYK